MAEDKDEKLGMMQVAYNAEWGLSKFVDAVVNDGVKKRFGLRAVCGRENVIQEAIARLGKEIYERNITAASDGSEKRNVDKQNENARILRRKLEDIEVPYFKINGTCEIPEQAYDLADIVVIHSKNIFHVDYIREAVRRGKHVLCEKPIVRTLDDLGEATRAQYDELKGILAAQKGSGLVLMDAEHYSYKTASLTFYEKIDAMLHGRKIVEIYGEVMEKDDPFHKRTMEILDPKNGTGLMGDTMCHLLAFISNLGGTSKPLSREFSRFSGDFEGKHVEYKVDTYDSAEFEVDGCPYIIGGSTAKFRVAKFIGKMNEPLESESKYIEFKLDDNSTIRLNFRDGSVVERKGDHRKPYHSLFPINSNEYVNILHHLHDAIRHGERPLTDMTNSMRTMDAIIGAYELGGKDVKIYN